VIEYEKVMLVWPTVNGQIAYKSKNNLENVCDISCI